MSVPSLLLADMVWESIMMDVRSSAFLKPRLGLLQQPGMSSMGHREAEHLRSAVLLTSTLC